jgi:peptidoglycan hydrolase FlgJ
MDALSIDVAKANIAATTPKQNGAASIDSTARDFEAVFVSQMLEQMFADVKTDGVGGGGSGERIFRSMMIQEVGKQMSAQGGMGLTDTIKRELLAMQEHGRK